MIEAQLKYRGEHFEVKIQDEVYEGQCNWSWEGEKENARKTHPVAIEAETIQRVGLKRLLGLSNEKRRDVAKLQLKH